MNIEFFLERLRENHGKTAVVWENQDFSYDWLTDKISRWETSFKTHDIQAGSVVCLTGDFSPNAIALFIALVNTSCIIVPLLATSTETHQTKAHEIAQVEFLISVSAQDEVSIQKTNQVAAHELYTMIRGKKHPGLVLFSSGSSGKPKAAVHDFLGLMEKFKEARSSMRILNFLLFDHWGGLNTMLHTLSSSGTVLTVQERSPEGICRAIEKFKIEVLPASPTFLNLLLISKAYQKHDLSSLKVISYGTEPMPAQTLEKVRALFPEVKLHQTYGLIELGVLRSKSKSSDSLWVKVGGDGFETRIVEGLLQIKAKSAMLGYLNAPSPFTDDGWFMTGDSVEVDGEYFRILGRKSELINVGGEKVYPQEVENVIQAMENIAEVTVYGEKNPLVGNIVCAKVRLIQEEESKLAIQRIKKNCREKLQSFKVPVKIEILTEKQYSDRYKKIRAQTQT
jgi:long-chain acyl-CoA synthetase